MTVQFSGPIARVSVDVDRPDSPYTVLTIHDTHDSRVNFVCSPQDLLCIREGVEQALNGSQPQGDSPQ